ncbi:hypothetical protein FHX74_001148 [Friedmanniella endophytica]|uniref:DUF5302 domain-containing protein n=1 Tax=Microlunatus kandeliicorticis TaxID=1759536 RepID=A0A7W3P533_9ACTN|nr:DUF5302 domain-containing protein [Microlunatus kandeliicorticis]MBA8793543.1 hypothetical protein [Microlunatus kandeliicorticis]
MTDEKTPADAEETAADAREATKAKFREALAHKQKRGGEDHIDRDPQQATSHGPVSEKRTFRRKTG